MFLVVGRGCWTGCFGEEEPGGGSDFVEEHVFIFEDGFAEEGAVEGFGSGDVADAEDEVVDGECWEHGSSLTRGVRMEPGVQLGDESGEGSAAMAEGELGSDVELGHGLVLGGEVEEGVVAEAFGAAGGREDFAFDGSVAD